MTSAKSLATTRKRKESDRSLETCYSCNGLQDLDARRKKHVVLKCSDCHRNVHAFCSGLSERSAEVTQTYDWQCNECKSCLMCHSNSDEDKIVFCTLCDRGYHTFCCEPQLTTIPDDDWYCSICSSMPSPSSVYSPQHPTFPQRPASISSDSAYEDDAGDEDDDTPSSEPLTPISDNQMITRRRQRRSNNEAPPHDPPRIRSSRLATRAISADEKPVSPETPPALIEKKTTRASARATTNDTVRLRLTAKANPVTVPSKRGRTKQEHGDEFFGTFGHKLSKTGADAKRATPADEDQTRFDKARARSEKHIPSSVTALLPAESGQGFDIPKISQIMFGDYLIDTWYIAPYPEEYSRQPILYICEFCMKYMKSSYVAGRHKLKCPIKHPPGDEIYRHGKVSIFEVDGRKNKIYCQNLCLLAKMFLDHKTLYYDVEPFLFYVMTEVDKRGCHFVGYFSKEKRSAMNYNVSCILTMPIYQRKGYGQYLIEFSYLLTKQENKTGTPERPLSDLGLLSYRSYWKNTLFRELKDQITSSVSVEELSLRTSMTPDDIISTLQINNVIRRDSQEVNRYVLQLRQDEIEAYLSRIKSKDYPRVDPAKLTWAPFVLSRDRLAALMGQATTLKRTDGENEEVEVVDA